MKCRGNTRKGVVKGAREVVVPFKLPRTTIRWARRGKSLYTGVFASGYFQIPRSSSIITQRHAEETSDAQYQALEQRNCSFPGDPNAQWSARECGSMISKRTRGMGARVDIKMK